MAFAAIGGLGVWWWFRESAPLPIPMAPPLAVHVAAPAVHFKYARCVDIAEDAGVRVLTVRNPWYPQQAPVRIALVAHGAPKPAGVFDGVMSVPLRRLAVTSTTMLPFLDQLDAWDALAACSAAEYAWNPIVRERVKAGTTAAIPPGDGVNVERLAGLRLDGFAHGGFTPLDGAAMKQLAALGATPIPVCEYAEPHPLGRAEWLKVFGALLGRESQAAAAFDGIAARYEQLATLAKGARRRPTVLVNAPFRGVWNMPAAGNNFARLLADAGADYLWAGEPGSQSLALDLEQVVRRAANAEVWLNPGMAKSRAEARNIDARLATFRPLAAGAVWASDRRTAPDGQGNDFWETAQARPDLYLADLIAALHPELLPGHSSVWLRKLP